MRVSSLSKRRPTYRTIHPLLLDRGVLFPARDHPVARAEPSSGLGDTFPLAGAQTDIQSATPSHFNVKLNHDIRPNNTFKQPTPSRLSPRDWPPCSPRAHHLHVTGLRSRSSTLVYGICASRSRH
ncbi:hypothetical protein FRC08_015602 [Ceratobasidium sp. 394]|nr:hypothetical protein FRC08_015602 [Ceratobasidium sp. 394]